MRRRGVLATTLAMRGDTPCAIIFEIGNGKKPP
jgi:hypothetical protein